MPKYKTRPIYVDAVQFDPRKKYPEGVKVRRGTIRSPTGEVPLGKPEYWIMTPNGKVLIAPGDWIITDKRGRQYASKPQDFERLYEQISEKGSEEKNAEDNKGNTPGVQGAEQGVRTPAGDSSDRAKRVGEKRMSGSDSVRADGEATGRKDP